MGKITVKREGSFVSFTREIDGKQLVTPCRDVRGALTWPTPISPYYFCIFAQENQTNLQGKLPLVLLAEGEDVLPHRFFQKMIMDARSLRCYQFYYDFSMENREVMSLFSEMSRYHRVAHIDLKRARLTNNFSFGIGLIREWAVAGGLQIPEKSILRAQLSSMSSEDLAQKPEEKFFAVNALRYLIGSLEKEPWQPSVFTVRVHEKKDPRGWT